MTRIIELHAENFDVLRYGGTSQELNKKTLMEWIFLLYDGESQDIICEECLKAFAEEFGCELDADPDIVVMENAIQASDVARIFNNSQRILIEKKLS